MKERMQRTMKNWIDNKKKLTKIFYFFSILQKDHFNRMHCWYRKDASSITYTMHRGVGHLSDGIKLVRPLVKIVACKCVALLCYSHVAFHYFRALNLYAVQSISKVSEIFIHCFFIIPNRILSLLRFFRFVSHSLWYETYFSSKKWFTTFVWLSERKKMKQKNSWYDTFVGMQSHTYTLHVDINLWLWSKYNYIWLCYTVKQELKYEANVKECHGVWQKGQQTEIWRENYSLIFSRNVLLHMCEWKFIVMRKICTQCDCK